MPKDIFTEFVKNCLTHDTLSQTNDEFSFRPISVCEDFLRKESPYVLVVFDVSDEGLDKCAYDTVSIDAVPEPEKLVTLINRQVKENEIVGGFLQDGRYVLLIETKPQSAKPQPAKQGRYSVTRVTADNRDYLKFDRCPVVAFLKSDNSGLAFNAVLDTLQRSSDSDSGSGWQQLKHLLGNERQNEFEQISGKKDSEPEHADKLIEILEYSLNCQRHEAFHPKPHDLRETYMRTFLTIAGKTFVYVFRP